VATNEKELKNECFGLATIPAKYETRTKKVCVKPAGKTYETIPAEYETVEKRFCVKSESKRRIDIPARYETRTKEVCAAPERKVWRLSACTLPVEKCDSCAAK
jgi:hypothetical protein